MRSASVSFEEGAATVVCDAATLTPDGLIAAMHRELQGHGMAFQISVLTAE